MYWPTIDVLLCHLLDSGASELDLLPGRPPWFRKDGKLSGHADFPSPLTSERCRKFVVDLLP
ncbi:MAG: hypothetical protein KGL53_00225, partial [Elusimicrobia bacterium]|nr:hypothetical protein [Elusimicrobiota bacterium]